MADEKKEEERKPPQFRSTMLEQGADSKTTKKVVWIVIGLIALVGLYLLLYTHTFKREKPETHSEVVIPQATTPEHPTLTQGSPDSTMAVQDSTPVQNQQPVQQEQKQPQQSEPIKETTTAPKTTGNYTVYVGSFTEEAVAEHEKARLIKKGMDAFIVPNADRFRVGVGKYETLKEATKAEHQLRKTVKKDAWVGAIK